ncbi:MAG: HAD-IA family hydrolase [Planctomycetes bacterium]|nr:HAD-IA family hydrolase [Planctomycetota bacterium]
MVSDIARTKAIIFDLDDTLYDCSGTLVVRGRRRVAKTMAKLIGCSEEEAFQLQNEVEEKNGTKCNVYEHIVAMYDLHPSYCKKLLDEYIFIEISDISLFPGVTDTLIQLKRQEYKLFLVTSGERQVQKHKIDMLGLGNNYFDKILIVERNGGKKKRDYFEDIMQHCQLKSEEIICVGDKIDDEIAAGKMLGMITVMYEHGRHYKSFLQKREFQIKPDYTIKNITDILKLLNKEESDVK